MGQFNNINKSEEFSSTDEEEDYSSKKKKKSFRKLLRQVQQTNRIQTKFVMKDNDNDISLTYEQETCFISDDFGKNKI